MALHVILLLHLVSAIVLRYNLGRSRGVLRMQFRALLVLNVLQLAFNPVVLSYAEGSEASWTLFVGYPVLALVLGIAALVHKGHAYHFITLLLPLKQRLSNTITNILGISRLDRPRRTSSRRTLNSTPSIGTFSPFGQRPVHKTSNPKSTALAILLSLSGHAGRLAIGTFHRTVTSAWTTVMLLAPLASGLLTKLVMVLANSYVAIKTTVASKTFAVGPLGAVPTLELLPFDGENRSTPVPWISEVPVSQSPGTMVARRQFFDEWLLQSMSCSLQFGCWVAVERVSYRPFAGAVTETWLISVHFMGFECDMNGVFSIWCSNTYLPDACFVTALANCHPICVNEDTLPAAWTQRFGGLWSSTSLDFVAALDVLKAPDPCLALVSLGRRPATARFLAHLKEYIFQHLEHLASISTSSTLTVATLPSRGLSRMPSSPVISAPQPFVFFTPGLRDDDERDILEAELIEQWTVGHEDSWVIDGCLVERYFVVPAEEWQFGDPLIHDSHVETCSTLLQVVDIEPDWQGTFWKILGNPLFPDIRIIHPIALEVTWLIVNEEALLENWILRFSGLWSSDLFTTLDVPKSSDTRFMVAHGRRTATSLFLTRLIRFVSQQLEQVKTIRERNVDSTVPVIKLPSRGKSRPAMPSAMSAPPDSITYEAGLVTTSVDPGIPLIDAPLASVHVKLSGAAPPAAQTQRYVGPCRCKESREKLESRAAVTPVTVDDNEDAPTTSDGAEKMDAQEPHRSVRVTPGGRRLFKNTLRGVLSHNDRDAPRCR